MFSVWICLDRRLDSSGRMDFGKVRGYKKDEQEEIQILASVPLSCVDEWYKVTTDGAEKKGFVEQCGQPTRRERLWSTLRKSYVSGDRRDQLRFKGSR